MDGGLVPSALRRQLRRTRGVSHAPRAAGGTCSTGWSCSRVARFTVSFEEIRGSAGGWCDAKARQIIVDADAPANARMRTLVHETIHALGVNYAEFGRERAEVIVDTAAYLVCSAVGLDVGGESVPYVAGWGEDGALEPSPGSPGRSTSSRGASRPP